jgi:hypothetical protein
MNGRKDNELDDSAETSDSQVAEKSPVAREIEDLQATVLRFARERERLPQPLFWSLFNARLRDIKKNKELERLLRESLG